ncbi:MAG: hypothetical protein GQ565_13790 [Candidatus Aegiribacteria sp.]|nr:hypothetical protein [Candidatus Aegiribacteria sp.]
MGEKKETRMGGKEAMAERKEIKAIVGQPVQIKLQSMAGSTGYSWYLTELDGGLTLSSAVVVPTAPGIAPINHVFDFLACATGSYKVVFELKAPWRPGDVADTEVFEVQIKAKKKTAKQDIESAMEGREFIRASAVNVGSQVEASQVIKYAAPMSSTGPTVILYAAPMTGLSATAAIPSQPGTLAAATMVAYAAPIGPSTVAAYGTSYATRQVDPCLQALQAQCPQPMYAAPAVQACMPGTLAASTMVAYAAPATAYGTSYAMRQVDPCLQALQAQYQQPVYMSPMVVQPYAAPWPYARS